MFAYVRNLQVKQSLLVEAPAFLTSLAVAEVFYKFHSFTLECLAFLATWLAISATATGVAALFFGGANAKSSK
jgi:hypothetical protein